MSDGRVRLPAKLRWCTTCRRVTTIVWHSHGLRVRVLSQRVNIRPSMQQTRSPQCFRYGINEQILFEVRRMALRDWASRWRNGHDDSDEDGSHFVQQSLSSSYHWSNRSGQQTLFSLLKLKCSSVTCACMNKTSLFVLKIFSVINFCGFHYPRKIFNNKIFPDYGI